MPRGASPLRLRRVKPLPRGRFGADAFSENAGPGPAATRSVPGGCAGGAPRPGQRMRRAAAARVKRRVFLRPALRRIFFAGGGENFAIRHVKGAPVQPPRRPRRRTVAVKARVRAPERVCL